MLAGCGAETENADRLSETDDFAARINGVDSTDRANAPVEAAQEPTIAPQPEDAASGVYSPGTATDPESVTCNANLMGPFLGQEANDATRTAVLVAAAGASEVRFIPVGSGTVNPDPTSPRLNMMLDADSIIRDARCG